MDSVSSGKIHIRANKMMNEALKRVLLDKFQQSLNAEYPEGKDLKGMRNALHLPCDDLSQRTYEEILTTDCFLKLSAQFELFKVTIEKSSASLSRFWVSYLNITGTILNLIYAQQTGNWQLYLYASSGILKWASACHRYNYARYLSLYLADIFNLEGDHPDANEEFSKGHFGGQISNHNTSGRNEADKVMENTINQDTKTPGGQTGLSVCRWTLNSSKRAPCRRNLHEIIKLKSLSKVHNDLGK